MCLVFHRHLFAKSSPVFFDGPIQVMVYGHTARTTSNTSHKYKYKYSARTVHTNLNISRVSIYSSFFHVWGQRESSAAPPKCYKTDVYIFVELPVDLSVTSAVVSKKLGPGSYYTP